MFPLYITITPNWYNKLGYLEGAITHSLIYDLQEMFYALYSNNSAINIQVTKWFEAHISWLEAQVADYKKDSAPLDPFWETANLLLAQLKGLTAGYNQYAPPGHVILPFSLFHSSLFEIIFFNKP